MQNLDQLIEAITDQLGIDVYNLYPDSKRLIPDTVLWGIAAACVIEFLKGLVGFSDLGKDVRGRANELAKRFKERTSFEPYVQTLGLSIRDDLVEVVQGARIHTASSDKAAGREEMKKALIEFGLHAKVANEHADKIASLIFDYLQKAA